MVLSDGDIFVYEPHETAKVEFLEDTVLVVVRNGSFPNDKYLT